MTKIKLSNRKSTPDVSPSGRALNNNGRGDGTQLIRRTLMKTSGNDEYVDSQFQQPPVRIPKKSILLAAFLFVFGSGLLVIATLSILNDHQESVYMDRIVPMIILGALMFIPGFYHVRIAYLSWMGVAGYNFDDIPEFE